MSFNSFGSLTRQFSCSLIGFSVLGLGLVELQFARQLEEKTVQEVTSAESGKSGASKVLDASDTGANPEQAKPDRIVLEPAAQKQRCDTLAKQNHEAKTAKDYSDLLDQIDKELATYEYLSSYQEYLKSLRAYALTRRGEMRMEIGFEFGLVGNSQQANKAFEQALQDFDKAIENSPQHWKAYLNRGVVLGKMQRWDEAAASFALSIKIRPNQTHAYFNLAEIDARQGRWAEALAGYDRILSTARDDRQALNGRGLALIGLDRGEEALELYEQLLQQGAQDPWLLTNKGDAHLSLGQWEQAEEAYIAALNQDQHSSFYRRLAWLYATCPDSQWHKPENALAVAKRSISSSKHVSAAQWDTLAAAQAASGAFDHAMDSLTQALRLEPENANLKKRLSLYQNQQRYVQAVRVASEESLLER